MTRTMSKIAAFLIFTLWASSAFAQSFDPVTPLGASPTEHPVFTWSAIPGATSYKLYVGQYGGDTIFAPNATTTGCPNGTGTCTYDPGVSCGVSSGAGVCTQGHTIGYWIEADNGSTILASSPMYMAYIPLAGMGENVTTNYATNYDFSWDATACTKWTYVNNFVGGQRRVIDLFVGSGTNNLGLQMFHQAMWNPVNISDLVPTGPMGARVARLKAEVGYSATCSAAASGGTCDLMGWAVRRHGTTEQNIPALQYYTSAERDFKEFDVLLDQNGVFDFYWDDGANGIYPRYVNSATVTGEFINATIIGYCTP